MSGRGGGRGRGRGRARGRGKGRSRGGEEVRPGRQQRVPWPPAPSSASTVAGRKHSIPKQSSGNYQNGTEPHFSEPPLPRSLEQSRQEPIAAISPSLTPSGACVNRVGGEEKKEQPCCQQQEPLPPSSASAVTGLSPSTPRQSSENYQSGTAPPFSEPSGSLEPCRQEPIAAVTPSLNPSSACVTPQHQGTTPQTPSLPHPAKTLPSQEASLPVSVPLSRVAGMEQKGPKNIYKKQQPPNRPGFGTAGRGMTVRANFYPIKFSVITVHHYDVTISSKMAGSKMTGAKMAKSQPKPPPKNICRKVYDEFQKIHLGRIVGAYDGSKSSYYTREPFRGESKEFLVPLQLEEKSREFTVTLKKAATFDVDPQRIQQMLSDASETMPMIQALDVVLRHLPSLRMIPVGRSFFSAPRPDSQFHLGAGREVWSGHYQSVRPTMGWKLMLNVDTVATAFYTQQSVFDFMCATLRKCHPADPAKPVSDQDRGAFGRRELTDFERRQFSREIKNVKIVSTHLPYKRKRTVVDVTRLSTRRQQFKLDDGSMCSVEEYFKKTYPKSPITHPFLPCLVVGPKDHPIYLPIDVCEILEGQRCVKKLTEMQMANMIRHTAKPASQRERAINDTIRSAKFDKDAVANEFGIRVETKMVEVPSRVLSPPTLKYNSGTDITPEDGKGCWDMRGKRFYQGIQVQNWAVVVCDDRCNYMEFVQGLVKQSGNMGMTMHPRPTVVVLGNRRLEEVFKRLVTSPPKLDLLVAIIDKRSAHYNQIKRLGDTQGGMAIATQCVLSSTVKKKCNPATLGNICLKINARLGGKNSIIQDIDRPQLLHRMPVIIFGADVTHPRSDDRESPSIASVVASVDLEGSRYAALHRNQKHRQEIIADLKDMVKEHMIEFKRCTKCKPMKIIFYRDGVSEGQFNEVRQHEIAALQGACRELQPDYQPKITFLVVQKRHHTRFFPTSRNPEDAGKGGNVPPGTTVDRVITHPTQHDFYLCSHAAIQGTSRPCHYHLLWDDSDFSADDIQLLTYQLCHMFWRCNRSVSYPAPTYYAHRDAAHARMLLQAAQDNASSGGSSVGSDCKISKADQDRAIEIHEDRKKQMYFM